MLFIYQPTTLLLFHLTAAYMARWVLYVVCMHKSWGLKRLLGVLRPRPGPSGEDSDDLMVLGHADVFNKYCLLAAPRIPFLSRAVVFYGGDAALLAYTLCTFPSAKHMIFYYFALLLRRGSLWSQFTLHFAVKHANMFCLPPLPIPFFSLSWEPRVCPWRSDTSSAPCCSTAPSSPPRSCCTKSSSAWDTSPLITPTTRYV